MKLVSLINGLLEKLIILVNRTSALVNGQSTKLVTLVNGTNAIVNGQIEKRVNLIMEQMLDLSYREHWYVIKLC